MLANYRYFNLQRELMQQSDEGKMEGSKNQSDRLQMGVLFTGRYCICYSQVDGQLNVCRNVLAMWILCHRCLSLIELQGHSKLKQSQVHMEHNLGQETLLGLEVCQKMKCKNATPKSAKCVARRQRG